MTRVRLPLLGSAGAVAEPALSLEAIWEPLPRDALLSPPGALVIVAGTAGARSRAAAAFVRALSGAGLRVAALQEARVGAARADLVAAHEALARGSEIVVADGNASLGLYRSNLSMLVGVGAAGAERGLRALLGRADIELPDASHDLIAALAALVVRTR